MIQEGRFKKAIILVRHGESLKNIEDRHGGQGAPLTQKGRREVEKIIEYLSNSKSSSRYIVYYSNRPQLIETAEIIGRYMGATLVCDERVSPLHLGVLDGLSREEAIRKYPKVEQLMERWRRGEIEISLLKIPQADDLEKFWSRGLRFINEISKEKAIHIVIGTRSILTLLISILLNRTIELGGGYKYIEIPTGGILSFIYNNNRYRISERLSNYRVEAY